MRKEEIGERHDITTHLIKIQILPMLVTKFSTLFVQIAKISNITSVGKNLKFNQVCVVVSHSSLSFSQNALLAMSMVSWGTLSIGVVPTHTHSNTVPTLMAASPSYLKGSQEIAACQYYPPLSAMMKTAAVELPHWKYLSRMPIGGRRKSSITKLLSNQNTVSMLCTFYYVKPNCWIICMF